MHNGQKGHSKMQKCFFEIFNKSNKHTSKSLHDRKLIIYLLFNYLFINKAFLFDDISLFPRRFIIMTSKIRP